jgi:hypothetical protein
MEHLGLFMYNAEVRKHIQVTALRPVYTKYVKYNTTKCII